MYLVMLMHWKGLDAESEPKFSDTIDGFVERAWMLMCHMFWMLEGFLVFRAVTCSGKNRSLHS